MTEYKKTSEKNKKIQKVHKIKNGRESTKCWKRQ